MPTVLYSEMAFARNLCKGEPRERGSDAAGGQRADVRGADRDQDDRRGGCGPGSPLRENGADFVVAEPGLSDLRGDAARGLGSALLKKPKEAVAADPGGMAEGDLPIPLEVKVRIGIDAVNIESVVEALEETGIAALTIHGRTAQQRYKKSADWDLIKRIAQNTQSTRSSANGDVLTLHEARASDRELRRGGRHDRAAAR